MRIWLSIVGLIPTAAVLSLISRMFYWDSTPLLVLTTASLVLTQLAMLVLLIHHLWRNR